MYLILYKEQSTALKANTLGFWEIRSPHSGIHFEGWFCIKRGDWLYISASVAANSRHIEVLFDLRKAAEDCRQKYAL
jgi:hypothetical protein